MIFGNHFAAMRFFGRHRPAIVAAIPAGILAGILRASCGHTRDHRPKLLRPSLRASCGHRPKLLWPSFRTFWSLCAAIMAVILRPCIGLSCGLRAAFFHEHLVKCTGLVAGIVGPCFGHPAAIFVEKCDLRKTDVAGIKRATF